MEIHRSEQDGIPVLSLEGEFDSFDTDTVADGFQACLDDGHTKIVLDCEKLLFVNSTTIAFLIKAQKMAGSRGGRIIFARPKAFIRKTFETLGLTQIFKMADSLDEAVKSLKAE